jgi:hypothetical protein
MRVELVALQRDIIALKLRVEDERLCDIVRVVKSLLLRRNSAYHIASWN